MKSISHGLHQLTRINSAGAAFLDRLTAAVARPVMDSRFLLHIIGKIRRFWLLHFRKQYVQTQLLFRHGHCRQCGTCCNLLFTCPMLTRQGKCLVYTLCRPGVCKVFPIDQRDIDEISLCGGHCGYFFKEKNSNMINETGNP